MSTSIKLRRSAVPGKVPTVEQLDLGEVAINTYDGKLFIKKNDGIESVVTIGETPGFTGSRGDTGFTGSQGVHGDVGFTGSAGTNGFTGSQGDAGFTGSAGTNGFTGSQGTNGFTGSKGDIGYTGSVGFVGSRGATGFTGSQGTTGFTGSKGDIGYTGSIGFTGSQGTAGFTGSQGATGFTGSKGDIGYTGSTGPVAGTDGQLIYNNGGVSAGANVWFDDTNQRLGIGTSTPSAALQVNGSGYTLLQVDYNSGYTTINNSTPNNGLWFQKNLGFSNNTGFSNVNSGGSIVFEADANISIKDAASSSYVRFVNSTRNVGINTVSPSARLDVVGDIEVNSNVNLNSEATTLATTTKTQVASFAAASFRSGKLIAQAYDSVTGEVQVSELLVAHNGTTASATEYGVVYTGANPIVVYDVDISAGNVRLMATRTTTNSTQYKVSETLMVA